jgi:glycyl-tRNA synthetase alpha subunit
MLMYIIQTEKLIILMLQLFEVADVEAHLALWFEMYETRGATCSLLEHKLVGPAYDYVLKCSHVV